MISIPFSGSKKNSYKTVRAIVEQGNYNAVYEPFGGSCVLSVNLFNDNLVKTAVANDYDHYFDNYETYLDYKDFVVEECYKHGLRKTRKDKDGYYFLDDEGNKIRVNHITLPKHCRNILQSIIAENVPEKYWRYMASGSNFAWGTVLSHDKIHIKDFTLFSRQLETTKQRKYLEILNRINLEHLDWKDFIDKYRDDINSNKSILILDPPYINTEQRYYKGQFTEDDTIELIKTLNELDCDFIFYNHDHNKILEWFKDTNYNSKTISTINPSRKDIMIYVNKTLNSGVFFNAKN